MSAAPHLIQRARRWWALQMLQTRAGQLAGLIRQIEESMECDSAEHAALLMELRRVNGRLAHAHMARQPRGTAW